MGTQLITNYMPRDSKTGKFGKFTNFRIPKTEVILAHYSGLLVPGSILGLAQIKLLAMVGGLE